MTSIAPAREEGLRGINALGLFCLAFIVLFHRSLAAIYQALFQSEFTSSVFGGAVFLLVATIVYQRRREFRELSLTPNPLFLVLTVVLAAGLVASVVLGIRTAEIAILPVLALAAGSAFLGKRFFFLTAVPFLLLVCVMPIWWPLSPVLKTTIVAVIEAVLGVIEKPVFASGYVLNLPGGSFLVDDGCAGLNYLTVSLIIALYSLEMHRLSIKRGAAFFTAIILLSIFANWMRILIIVLVGDATNMEHRFVNDHEDLGWLVYVVVVLAPCYLILNKLSAQDPHQGDRVLAAEGEQSHARSDNSPTLSYFLLVISILLIAASSSWLLAP